jgi:Type III restriction enzyme, res subunit
MILRLRPYQERAVMEIREGYQKGLPRILYVLTTGGGKTITPSKDDHRLGSLPRLQRCCECGALNHPAPVFANCGATSGQIEIDVELNEVRRDVLIRELELAPHDDAVKWAGNSVDWLRLVVRAKGYRSGWIYHRLREAAA